MRKIVWLPVLLAGMVTVVLTGWYFVSGRQPADRELEVYLLNYQQGVAYSLTPQEVRAAVTSGEWIEFRHLPTNIADRYVTVRVADSGTAEVVLVRSPGGSRSTMTVPLPPVEAQAIIDAIRAMKPEEYSGSYTAPGMDFANEELHWQLGGRRGRIHCRVATARIVYRAYELLAPVVTRAEQQLAASAGIPDTGTPG